MTQLERLFDAWLLHWASISMEQWGNSRKWSKWANTFFKVRCTLSAVGDCLHFHTSQQTLTQHDVLPLPTQQKEKPLGSEPWFNPEAVTEQKVSKG